MPKVTTSASTSSNSSNGNGKPKDPKDTPKEREQRTVREMAMMHLLRHPNICQLKEWITEGDYYYMFLEYVNGGQLLDYIISHGKLREKQARKFARQIVSALGKLFLRRMLMYILTRTHYFRLLSSQFYCSSW